MSFLIVSLITYDIPTVQTANIDWNLSKKKNMNNNEQEAPSGSNMACVELMVWESIQNE